MLKTAVTIDLIGNLKAQAAKDAGALREIGAAAKGAEDSLGRVRDVNGRWIRQNGEAARSLTHVGAAANAAMTTIKALGRVGAASITGLKRAGELAGQGLETLGNRYTALAASLAAGGTGQWVNQWETDFTMLRLSANATQQQMQELKQSIFDTAQQADIRIAPEALKEASETIIEYTGNYQLAKDNLRTIGVAIRASGLDAKSAGALISEFYEKGKLTNAEDMLKALDDLRTMGEAGKFTLQNLATEGAALTTAFASMGYTGLSLVHQMGALSQVALKASGSPAEASTAMQSLLKDLIAQADKLKKLGVSVWDEKASKEAGQNVARDANAIIADTLKAAKGSPGVLLSIFGEESFRLMSSMQRNPEMLNEFYKVQADGSEIQREAAVAANSLSAGVENLHTTWKRFADANLAAPLQDVANALNSVEPKRMQEALATAGKAALALGGVLAVYKGFTLGKATWNTIGGIMGKTAGAGLGVQQVFVTNWPATMSPNPIAAMAKTASSPADYWNMGGIGGGAETAASTKTPGFFGRMGERLGKTRVGGVLARTGTRIVGSRAGAAVASLGAKVGGLGRLAGGGAGLLSAGLSGYDAYQAYQDPMLTEQQKYAAVGKSAGNWAGGMAGMKLGAMAGTLLAPGVGTVVGGLAGGALGAVGGGALLEWVGEKLAEPTKVEQKLNGEMVLRIESPTPVKIAKMSWENPGMDWAVDNGAMMVMP